MVVLGYSLSSEEHGPLELVEQAQHAEQAGFEFVVISDHYHPWTSRQWNSPFAWSVLGGIAMATRHIQVGTAVTCPTMRYHPAIVAQAAATAAAMMPGRFMLGLGSGELLNEHVVGQYWPPPALRVGMLREAIEVIRALWSGKEVDHHGRYFNVDQATIYTLPEELPPIVVGATGPTSAKLAAENDGVMLMSPSKPVIETFDQNGGAGKPHYGQITVSWAPDDETARRNAHEYWPNSAISGVLNTELPTTGSYDAAVKLVDEATAANSLTCASRPGPIIEVIQKYASAGATHVTMHAIGPNPGAFMDFFSREISPQLARAA